MQRNNYLYRVFLVEDAPTDHPNFAINAAVYTRWKYYDSGPTNAALAAVNSRIDALSTRIDGTVQPTTQLSDLVNNWPTTADWEIDSTNRD